MTLSQDEKSREDNSFVWTTEQVIGLAPDKYHIRTSRTFAIPEKWQQLGQANQTIWGIFPIKGKPSLFALVDPTRFSLSCSCKSRKSPCNHLLSLLLLYIEAPGSFTETTIPTEYAHDLDLFVSDSSQKRGPNTQPKDTTKTRSPDAVRRDIARREERRKHNINVGLLELELWLHDMIEHGLAAVQDHPKSYWTNMADRLVDYQVSEIAHHIRAMSLLPGKEVDWHDTLLQKVSWLYLLIQGFKRYDDLPLTVQMDLRLAIGWMPRIEEAAAPDLDQSSQDQAWEMVSDSWAIVGKQTELRGKQSLQRTWLWGERSNRAALILDVITGKRLLSSVHIVGAAFDATLAFVPSTTPLYARISTAPNGATQTEQASDILTRRQADSFVDGYDSIGSSMKRYREAITENPWLRYFPIALNGVTIESIGEQSRKSNSRKGNSSSRWGIRDVLSHVNVLSTSAIGKESTVHLLPLPANFTQQWHLQALCYRQPLSIFGEWDGTVFTPLSIWYDNRLIEMRVLGGTV